MGRSRSPCGAKLGTGRREWGWRKLRRSVLSGCGEPLRFSGLVDHVALRPRCLRGGMLHATPRNGKTASVARGARVVELRGFEPLTS